MDGQFDIKKTKKKILRIYLITIALFLILFLVILPYRFYERDIQKAERDAITISELIKSSVLSTMVATGDSNVIRALIKKYQDKYPFKYRLIRGSFVKKQHGTDTDSQNTDAFIDDVLATGKGGKSWLPETKFRYITPFIADPICAGCHEDLNGEKIKAGTVLGASEIIFDLKPQKYKSIRFISEILAMIIITLLSLGYVLYYVVDKGILSHLESKN